LLLASILVFYVMCWTALLITLFERKKNETKRNISRHV